jgi:hypothetical protein
MPDAPPESTTTGEPGTTPPVGEPATGETTDWKAEAEKWKALSRQNEGKAKANAGAAEQWAKVAGLFEGEKPDADQLAAKLTDAQRQAQTWQDSAGAAQVENIVLRTAYRLGANADRILDSRAMCDEIDDLEPEGAADFAAQVEAKIKGWVEKDPTLKAATASGPARIGAEHTGSGGNTSRPTSVRDAYARKYGG